MRCVLVESGTGVLVATEDSTCTSGQYVLVTQGELDYYTVSPFRLSVADGGYVSGLVVAVWVAAHYFKALIRVLNSDGDATSN